MSGPSLSVIAAAWPDLRGLTEMLKTLARDRVEDCDVTIVATRPRPLEVERDFPWATWLDTPESSLIPEMWAAGIMATGGEVAITTTTHFRPQEGWLDSIRRAHTLSEAPAIGGPIDPPEARGAVAWAVYLLRYGSYPVGATSVLKVVDLPGDNASYKRRALDAHPQFVRGGFWERDFHRALLAEGAELLFDPRIRVRQHECFDLGTFLSQRYRHGRQFGRARLKGRSRALGLPGAFAAAVLVPPLLIGRNLARAALARRPFLSVLSALPPLAAFAGAWGLGEAVGYLSHAFHREPAGA